MKKLTQEEFLGLIRDDVETEGSQKALAARLEVSETYLSDVLRGRRAAGSKILARYHLRAVTSYHPLEEDKEKSSEARELMLDGIKYKMLLGYKQGKISLGTLTKKLGISLSEALRHSNALQISGRTERAGL